LMSALAEVSIPALFDMGTESSTLMPGCQRVTSADTYSPRRECGFLGDGDGGFLLETPPPKSPARCSERNLQMPSGVRRFPDGKRKARRCALKASQGRFHTRKGSQIRIVPRFWRLEPVSRCPLGERPVVNMTLKQRSPYAHRKWRHAKSRILLDDSDITHRITMKEGRQDGPRATLAGLFSTKVWEHE